MNELVKEALFEVLLSAKVLALVWKVGSLIAQVAKEPQPGMRDEALIPVTFASTHDFRDGRRASDGAP